MPLRRWATIDIRRAPLLARLARPGALYRGRSTPTTRYRTAASSVHLCPEHSEPRWKNSKAIKAYFPPVGSIRPKRWPMPGHSRENYFPPEGSSSTPKHWPTPGSIIEPFDDRFELRSTVRVTGGAGSDGCLTNSAGDAPLRSPSTAVSPSSVRPSWRRPAAAPIPACRRSWRRGPFLPASQLRTFEAMASGGESPAPASRAWWLSSPKDGEHRDRSWWRANRLF